MNCTVTDLLHDAVATHSDKYCIYEGEKKVSFKELDQYSDSMASYLLEKGIKKGDHIVTLTLNQIEYVVTLYALAKIGAILVPLNTRYRDSELVYMINNAEAKVIISVDSYNGFNYISFFDSFRDRIPTVEHYVFVGKGFMVGLLFNEIISGGSKTEQLAEFEKQVKPDDTLIMIYTSGTTGKPKGTMLTHKSMISAAKVSDVDYCNLSEADVIVRGMPINHVGGLSAIVLPGLISKCSYVLLPEFRAKDALEAVHNYRATIVGGVPTMYKMIFDKKDLSDFNYDLTSIRMCTVGGANVEPELMKLIAKHIPNACVVNTYGATEVSGSCIRSMLNDTLEKKCACLGKVLGDFKAKVVDDQKNEVKVGQVGELAISGDCVSKGYYHLPETTRETFSPDGWAYLGDLVSMDEEGYVYFKGRKKEMWVQGGYNVYPSEIENLLTTHPKVKMAVGIGIPDDFYGEIGCLFIVPSPDTQPTERELIEYCRKNLADYKVPKHIVLLDESQLPLTHSKKVQKTKLKEQYFKEQSS